MKKADLAMVEQFCSHHLSLDPTPDPANVWAYQLWRLTTPSWGATLFSDTERRHRMLTLAYMAKVNRQWMPKLKMPPTTKSGREHLKASATVAHEFLALLDLIQQRCPHYLQGRHQAEWFGDALLEREVLGLYRGTEVSGKKEMVRLMRDENQALWTLDRNPFSQPSARVAFDVALDLAIHQGGNAFASQIRKFVSARRALVKVVDASADPTRQKMPDGSSSIVRQGRSKKTVSVEPLPCKGFSGKRQAVDS